MGKDLTTLTDAELHKECHRRRRQCASGYASGSASVALAGVTAGYSLIPTLLYTIPRTMYIHAKKDEIETEYRRRGLRKPSIDTGDVLVPMALGTCSFVLTGAAEGVAFADHAVGVVTTAPDPSGLGGDAFLGPADTPAVPIPAEHATEFVHGFAEGVNNVGEAIANPADALDGANNLFSEFVANGGNAPDYIYNMPGTELLGVTAGVAVIEEGFIKVGETMMESEKHPKAKSL